MTLRELIKKPNVWASILLVITGLIKLFGVSFIPPVVTTTIMGIALLYIGFNIIRHFFQGGLWDSSQSYNFALQLWGIVTYLAPFFNSLLTTTDYDAVFRAAMQEDYKQILLIVGMAIYRLLSDTFKPKKV